MSEVKALQEQIQGWEVRLQEAEAVANSAGLTAVLGDPKESEAMFVEAATAAQVARQALQVLRARMPEAERIDALARADALEAEADPLVREVLRLESEEAKLLDRLELLTGVRYVPPRMTTPKHEALRQQAAQLRMEASQLRRQHNRAKVAA